MQLRLAGPSAVLWLLVALAAAAAADAPAKEPGSDAEIAEFCSATYKVKFPMFSKVDVNGANAAPLYKHLKAQDKGPADAGEIKWNFEKFVIGKNGEVVARFAPRTKPDAPEVLKVLEAELAKK